MVNWENKTNDEIRSSQIEMFEKYESIKKEIVILATKINSLTKKLDEMDNSYAESNKVLKFRLKY